MKIHKTNYLGCRAHKKLRNSASSSEYFMLLRVVWLIWGKQKSLDNACHFFSHISFCKLSTLVDIFFKNLFLFAATCFYKVNRSSFRAIIWKMAWLVASETLTWIWMCIRVIIDLLLLLVSTLSIRLNRDWSFTSILRQILSWRGIFIAVIIAAWSCLPLWSKRRFLGWSTKVTLSADRGPIDLIIHFHRQINYICHGSNPLKSQSILNNQL